MNEDRASRIPSLVKKYLMAATGLVLTLFVLGHMLGNLQIYYPSPDKINRYAFFLQSLGEFLWLIRLFLLACVVVHVWMAILLTLENKKARPKHYRRESTIQASYASRTMIWSGLIIMAFIIFHLAHYTLMVVHPIFHSMYYEHDGIRMHDVYGMMIVGFSYPLVAAFYVVAVYLLCVHLSHGVSSMFQSVGLRNEKWRAFLNRVAKAYGAVVFIGFASVPITVQLSLHTSVQMLPARTVVEQMSKEADAWNPDHPTAVEVDYRLASFDGGETQMATPAK